jgi:predicted SAM-dependent methyltransferase
MKLHLGCGPHIKPGWDNLDLYPGPGGIKHDLRKRLPYPDASVDFIFSEHFIEHVSFLEGRSFFNDCFRVLKPKGVLRLSTPSLKLLVSDYLSGNLSRWESVWKPKTGAQMLNEGMRLWGHEFIYDAPQLIESLVTAKFADVTFMQWQKSPHTELTGLEVRPFHGELIVEATK